MKVYQGWLVGRKSTLELNGKHLPDWETYKSIRDELCHNGPGILSGKNLAQRTNLRRGEKGDELIWHISSHLGSADASKGSAFRQLKWYVGWVLNVVGQFGFYLLLDIKNKRIRFLVRKNQHFSTYGTGWFN